MTNVEIIQKLQCGMPSKDELVQLISSYTKSDAQYAASLARNIADSIYGREIYLRGLIEISNYCKNDCLYCGIRRSNTNCSRYRLTKQEILDCCNEGDKIGFRTFVLQGGEDLRFSCDDICDIVRSIKKNHPESAVTLSLGEKTYEEYKAYRDAGADRYLLRHETANNEHYSKLHPASMSLENRKRCLSQLKELEFQTGAGMMIGSPYQTAEHLAQDMLYLKELSPQMVGIGPFIPHKDTPFANEKRGSLELTVFMLSLVRIMLPHVLLPATTALGTINEKGREMGVLAGANVIMPNLSPDSVKQKYMLYDGKLSEGSESAKSVSQMIDKMNAIGFSVSFSRGDYKN